MGSEEPVGTAGVSQRVALDWAASVALLQATVPDYRVPLFEALGHRLRRPLIVVCGDEDFSPSVRLGPGLSCHVAVTNVFFGGRRFLWQRDTVRRMTKPGVAILELNPRILNTWAILIARRLGNRRSVLFGHAWPRQGPDARSDIIRHLMRRLADAIIVYTDSEAAELARRMPGHEITSAPNALYSRSLAVRNPQHRLARDVIVVGRLVDTKKPTLVVDAFAEALDALPQDARLVFVGDGPLRNAIRERVSAYGLEDRVELAGHVADFEQLSAIYGRALVSVAPGQAGLSLTQSLWFGVPVLLATNELHGPETEAAEPGLNAAFFVSDSPANLSRAILDVFAEREGWLDRAQVIASACVERYSLEAMVEAMVELVEPR